jgi:hypothetical protein
MDNWHSDIELAVLKAEARDRHRKAALEYEARATHPQQPYWLRRMLQSLSTAVRAWRTSAHLPQPIPSESDAR